MGVGSGSDDGVFVGDIAGVESKGVSLLLLSKTSKAERLEEGVPWTGFRGKVFVALV